MENSKDMVRVTIRLRGDQVDSIKQAAAEEDTSMQQIIHEALDIYFSGFSKFVAEKRGRII